MDTWGRERDEAFCVMGSALMRKMPPKTKSQQASKIEKKQQALLCSLRMALLARAEVRVTCRAGGRGESEVR